MPARVEVGARRPFSSILIVQTTVVCGSGAYQVRPKWVTPAAAGVSGVMVSTTSSVMFPASSTHDALTDWSLPGVRTITGWV
jgi:hypothetical protein